MKINSFFKNSILFLIGGSIYWLIEFVYKTYIHSGNTHWSMFILGGLSFLILGSLNENIPWNWSLLTQGLIGTAIITSLEFLFGYILNIQLQLNIWDYSHLPFNYKGQICLPFSCLWFILGLIGIILDDFLRWKIFDEEKPYYHII
jgi:uncharacterized membrane protein